MKFKSKNPHYEHLRKKWLFRHRYTTQKLFDKHLRHMAAGTLGGLMLLSTPGLALTATPILDNTAKIGVASSKNALLAAQLLDKIPDEVRPLTAEEEKQIEQLVSKDLGIKVATQIDGIRLNRSYGLIGGEQHLYRYPGDNIYAHAQNGRDWAMYGSSGIAPGLGAWGYFTPSKAQFNQIDEQRERYYLAVQTFLAPGFAENVSLYRDFFKYRKMLVINPKTGQAVIAVVADAGPAEWTGKNLGGSPEVMYELGLATGPRKGAVLYFFVDDPEDKTPLGPVKVSND